MPIFNPPLAAPCFFKGKNMVIPPQKTGPAFSKGYDLGITDTNLRLAVIFFDHPPYGYPLSVLIRPCWIIPAAVPVIPILWIKGLIIYILTLVYYFIEGRSPLIVWCFALDLGLPSNNYCEWLGPNIFIM